VPTLQFSLTVAAAAASLPTPPPPCHSPGRRCRLLTWPPEPPPPPRSAARCCLIARPPPRHLAVGAALPGRRLLLGQPFGTASLPGHRRPSIYEPMCQIRVPAPRPSIFVVTDECNLIYIFIGATSMTNIWIYSSVPTNTLI
jgi:hypothetical protein